MSLPASSSDATAFWKPILDRRIEIVKDYQERVSASIRKCNHWAQLLPKGLNILQDSINYSLELLERLEGDKDELVDELRALSAANRPLAETALSMHKWRLLTKIISELDKNKPIFGITTWDDVEAFAKMYLGGVPTGWMLAEVAAWWSTRLLTLTRVSSQASTTCFDLDNEDWKLREMVVVFRGHILKPFKALVSGNGGSVSGNDGPVSGNSDFKEIAKVAKKLLGTLDERNTVDCSAVVDIANIASLRCGQGSDYFFG